jgi:hypothetical protein
MRTYPIIVTDRDLSRMRGLFGRVSLASLDEQFHLGELQSELDRALVLAADEVPSGVITIHSRVRVADLDTGKRIILTLVLPDEATRNERRVSVLEPLGAALLGLRAGDGIEIAMPGGMRRLHIEHVVQPGQLAGRRRLRAARAPASSAGN